MKASLNLLLAVGLGALLFACTATDQQNKTGPAKDDSASLADSRHQIAGVLDSFNLAAARADFQGYFGYLADDATFVGTDATEHWDKKSFATWAKPYFDKKTTWHFKSIQRQIYFAKTGDIAWFDELLSTQMKICRGSGVVVKQHNTWKIQQYVLSMTVPNNALDAAVKIKAPIEDSLLTKLTELNNSE